MMAESQNQIPVPELSLEWIRDAELIEIPEKARDLLERYSMVPQNDVMSHIGKVRSEALNIFPYPCIGCYRFLDIQIVKSQDYDEILGKLKNGARLIDVGCCIGQELRQLVADGASSEQLYGIDLYESFFDVGYDLFRDLDRFKGTFIAADLFNFNPQLASLEGSFDIVWTANFLHLFTWDKQVIALTTMMKLLHRGPDVMIAGRFMGNSAPGEYDYCFQGENESMFRHDAQSFSRLLNEVMDITQETWKVDIETPVWQETLKLKSQGSEDSTWTLEMRFVARRL